MKDNALFLEVLAGYDEGRDPRQYYTEVDKNYSKNLDGDVKGMKMAVLKEGLEIANMTKEVKQVFARSVENLKELGAEVEEVSLKAHQEALLAWEGITFDGF